MSLRRFYCPDLNKDQNNLTISDKEEVHHLCNVLCFKVGEEVTVFNGNGLEAIGVITSLSKKVAQIAVKNFSIHAQRKPLLVLACAIPKRSKFETIIEKCTELGVDEIIPLKTARTEISGSIENLQHKTKRFSEVVINASKQSQRSFLPKILPVMTLEKMFSNLATASHDLFLIGSLVDDKKRLIDIPRDQLKKAERIYVLIGPEGDFTPQEIGLAITKGCLPINLGPQVLRVETAATCAISYLMLLLHS